MFAYPFRTAALALTAVVGLSACTSPYGYSGVSIGAGNGGYYDPYYGGYGYDAGYGYGGYGYPGYNLAYAPYWGWYDDCYYPGTGYYVYDRHHRRHHWTDAQRRYWQSRRDRAVASGTTSQPVVIRENWDGFRRDRTTARDNGVERRQERQVRSERQIDSSAAAEGRQERVVRTERTERTERTAGTERVERSALQAQRAAAREERQTTRETRRSEARAERPSRGTGRGRGSSED